MNYPFSENALHFAISEVRAKFPNAETAFTGNNFTIHQNGKCIIPTTYGEDLQIAKTVEQAWINAYTTTCVWDKSVNRSVKGVARPADLELNIEAFDIY